MNNNKSDKEFITEEILIRKIRESVQNVKAPELAFKTILASLPDAAGNIPSPYISPFAKFVPKINKTFVTSLVLLLLALGGGFAYRINSNDSIKLSPNLNSLNQNNSDISPISKSDTSDNTLEQDMAVVDKELQMLDADNAQI